MVVKFVQSNLAIFLDSKMRISQKYSFIVFGLHGSGLHSLLYYISLCKDRNNQHVFPMPFHIFSNNFDLYGRFKCVRFFFRMYPILRKKNIAYWGLTLDGTKHTKQWLQHNITKKVPIIILVRDPIQRLLSIINFEIFLHIHAQQAFSTYGLFKKIIEREIVNTSNELSNIFNISTSQKIYIDSDNLTGVATYPTIQKICKSLGLKASFNESFEYAINSPIQRYFTDPIIYNNQKFYLSSFPHFFRITCYPHYFSPNYCDDLGYLYQQEYISPIFPNQKFYLFSQYQVEIDERFKSKIEKYLENFKNILIQYDNKKINLSTFLEFAKNNDHIRYIQDTLLKETSVIPMEITQKWETYQSFMQIKN